MGGGAHLSQLWRGLFVDVAFSVLSRKGERVALTDGKIVPLGTPLTVRLRHLDLAAGWRYAIRRVSLYAGARLRVAQATSPDSPPMAGAPAAARDCRVPAPGGPADCAGPLTKYRFTAYPTNN